MKESEELKSALSIQKGVSQPPGIKPDAVKRLSNKRLKKYTVEQYVDGILSCDRTILSQEYLEQIPQKIVLINNNIYLCAH